MMPTATQNPGVVADKTVDVIVVGAGLSGLRAATLLHEAGLEVAVLEAMDRVGGKTLSLNVPTGPEGKSGVIDLGAAWINDTNQSEIYKLARELGFDLIQQRATGLDINETDNGQFATAPYGSGAEDEAHIASAESVSPEAKAAVALYQAVEAHNVDHPLEGPGSAEQDVATFCEYMTACGGDERVCGIADHMSTAWLGCESDEVSALYMIDYIKSGTGLDNMSSDKKDGAQYLRNRQGNQSFSTRLADKLPRGTVHLSSPVARVRQVGPGRTLVETATGQNFAARKVVLSVPSALHPLISFDPPLPAVRQAFNEATTLGYYSKTNLTFARPWWRNAGLSGRLTTHTGPVCFTRDTCAEADEQYSITCFHVGNRGRKWSKLDAEGRRTQVLDHFDKSFGEVARRLGVTPETPVKVSEMDWAEDPWVRGAPCPFTGPGGMIAAGRSIHEPVGDVHFIGTETSSVWKGYLEGAVRSGIRGAGEVIEALRQAKL